MNVTVRSIFWLVAVVWASQAQGEQFSALVFADAYDRHHYRNVPVARDAFESLARKHFFKMQWVDTDDKFAQQTFSDYDVIVFVSANPCELNEQKRAELVDYVKAGGGIVGVHSASATASEPKRWLWWEELVGRVFLKHPVQQSAVMTIVDEEFPACLHLNPRWLWTDEWYEFETPFPESLKVVLTVDESSYEPSEDHAMGDWHPISWYHEPQGARVFYTAIGHITESYRDPVFIQHLYGGMLWAIGERGRKRR